MLELQEQEVMLIKRQATYVYELPLQITGDLYVTDQRTVFKSKKVQWLQKESIEIRHRDIQHVQAFYAFHLLPSGLSISLTSGEIYRFKLVGREEFLTIYAAMNLTAL